MKYVTAPAPVSVTASKDQYRNLPASAFSPVAVGTKMGVEPATMIESAPSGTKFVPAPTAARMEQAPAPVVAAAPQVQKAIVSAPTGMHMDVVVIEEDMPMTSAETKIATHFDEGYDEIVIRVDASKKRAKNGEFTHEIHLWFVDTTKAMHQTPLRKNIRFVGQEPRNIGKEVSKNSELMHDAPIKRLIAKRFGVPVDSVSSWRAQRATIGEVRMLQTMVPNDTDVYGVVIEGVTGGDVLNQIITDDGQRVACYIYGNKASYVGPACPEALYSADQQSEALTLATLCVAQQNVSSLAPKKADDHNTKISLCGAQFLFAFDQLGPLLSTYKDRHTLSLQERALVEMLIEVEGEYEDAKLGDKITRMLQALDERASHGGIHSWEIVDNGTHFLVPTKFAEIVADALKAQVAAAGDMSTGNFSISVTKSGGKTEGMQMLLGVKYVTHGGFCLIAEIPQQ